MEVVGLVRVLPERCGDCSDPPLPTLPERQGHPDWPQVSVTIWRISDAGRDEAGPKIKPLDTTLEALVSSPGKRDGQLVRVVGKFRGRNLYGDLPVKSQRSNSDWVIKDEVWAVWVTGKKPKGSGWQLDPNAKRDTGRWIEVVGRPLTRDGITYLQAREVALTTPPTPSAGPSAAPPPPELPRIPPVVVFALPLDGDTEVTTDSRFVVQFSEDMEEASFKDRVILRYAGPIRPGDRAFVGLKLSYDGGKRALTVDPGDVLRQGRLVELLLLPGIAHIHWLTLVPRPGPEAGAAGGPGGGAPGVWGGRRAAGPSVRMMPRGITRSAAASFAYTGRPAGSSCGILERSSWLRWPSWHSASPRFSGSARSSCRR